MHDSGRDLIMQGFFDPSTFMRLREECLFSLYTLLLNKLCDKLLIDDDDAAILRRVGLQHPLWVLGVHGS